MWRDATGTRQLFLAGSMHCEPLPTPAVPRGGLVSQMVLAANDLRNLLAHGGARQVAQAGDGTWRCPVLSRP